MQRQEPEGSWHAGESFFEHLKVIWLGIGAVPIPREELEIGLFAHSRATQPYWTQLTHSRLSLSFSLSKQFRAENGHLTCRHSFPACQ